VEGDATPRDFGVYIHVPFCTVRCGYCDFNTYAPGEVDGATPASYAAAARREMALARTSMAERDPGDTRAASTVFFGGGTPTMLDAGALAALLTGVREEWGLAADAEVTTEANPDTVTAESLHALAAAGFTRVSLGMQSAVPHVLHTLERTHNPKQVARAVRWAKEAGLGVSVDLIYGTPGESMEDWRVSVDQALALEPHHLSAYALSIEPGTRMGAALRRGQIDPVDSDLQAQMYDAADDALTAAGLTWYEVSNWARTPADRCRHNMAYWTSQDWWGIGPGAHSYLGPVGAVPARRWWNVKHPRAYAARIAADELPEQEGETLDAADLALEAVMLRIRLASGMPVEDIPLEAGARATAVARLMAEGVLDGVAALQGTLRLTRRGRMLADHAVRLLTP